MVYLGNNYLEYDEEINVIEAVKHHIGNLRSYMVFENLDFTVTDLKVIGSRVNGTHRPDSDLDMLITYVGEAREDDLHNCLNDPDNVMYYEGFLVDFIPVRDESNYKNTSSVINN